MKREKSKGSSGAHCVLMGRTLFLVILVLLVRDAVGQDDTKPFLPRTKEKARVLVKAFGNNALQKANPEYAPLAMSFLEAADSLEAISPRKIYVKKNPRAYLAPSLFRLLPSEKRASYSELTCDEKLYYGNYSTPLAWARPFDRLGQHGLDSFDGKKILDFGFGNVGQLRMMASLGASVTGIEIEESIPSAMYHLDSDQGDVRRHNESVGSAGTLKLVFGKWPSTEATVQSVGEGYDLFISKNVLKYGYIHPEREAPASQLIELGVSDEQFLKAIFRILKPGGIVLVYNLHPPKSTASERYKPWAYGETPWEREMAEKVGFEIIKWHVDDSAAIHKFGRLIDWHKSYSSEDEFKKNFRAMYTILRKPVN